MTRILHGDCLDVLRTLPDCTIDSVVTDPPYSLSFMGRKWDSWESPIAFQQWCQSWATECLRVLKPGGHMLAFGGTRTYHRLTSGIEDAGFEIRETIQWIHGQGFPKNLDVSKAIDKSCGAEREVVGQRTDGRYAYEFSAAASRSGGIMGNPSEQTSRGVISAPATEEAQRWAGWGTALKPAHEPIVMARKPLAERTIAANVVAHGTGALNVDVCRVAATPEDIALQRRRTGGVMYEDHGRNVYGAGKRLPAGNAAGRWPANVLLSHDDSCNGECVPGCAVAELDRQSGVTSSSQRPLRRVRSLGDTDRGWRVRHDAMSGMAYSDSGGASRFFPTFRYQAKPSPREKSAGLDDRNPHPTTKSTALMGWLVRLVTPPGGTVLDPFAGSGSTLVAAILEGFEAIGIEQEADYLPLIEGRVAWAEAQCEQPALPLGAVS